MDLLSLAAAACTTRTYMKLKRVLYKIDETPTLIIRGKVNKASFVDQLASQFFHEQAPSSLRSSVKQMSTSMGDTRDQQIVFVRTRCPMHQVCSMLFVAD